MIKFLSKLIERIRRPVYVVSSNDEEMDRLLHQIKKQSLEIEEQKLEIQTLKNQLFSNRVEVNPDCNSFDNLIQIKLSTHGVAGRDREKLLEHVVHELVKKAGW
jgi:hypothetical protein